MFFEGWIGSVDIYFFVGSKLVWFFKICDLNWMFIIWDYFLIVGLSYKIRLELLLEILLCVLILIGFGDGVSIYDLFWEL